MGWYTGDSERGRRVMAFLDGCSEMKSRLKSLTNYLGENSLFLRYDHDTARQMRQAYKGFEEEATMSARHRYYQKMGGVESWLQAQPEENEITHDPDFLLEAVGFVGNLRRQAQALVDDDPGIATVQNDLGLAESALISASRISDADSVCSFIDKATKRLTLAGEVIRDSEQAMIEYAKNDEQIQMGMTMYCEAENARKSESSVTEEAERRTKKNAELQKLREEGYMWGNNDAIVKYPRTNFRD